MRHSASVLFIIPLTLQAVACAPDDAEIKGSWHVWLAANSSNTIENEDIPNVEEASTHFECVRTWDLDKDRWADGYIGPEDLDSWDLDDPMYVGGPCQATVADDGDTEDDISDDTYELYPGLIADEGDDPTYLESVCTQEMMAKFVADCSPIQESTGSSAFLAEDGYYALQGDLEAWRTEAILTGENELQISLHQRIAGEDWHFIWVIDPDHRPVRCDSRDVAEGGDPSEGGGAEVVPIGGNTWVDEWSATEDGYSIYYINAGAFHTPDQGDTLWYFPRTWTAGFGYGKFIGEEFLSVTPVIRNTLSFVDEELDYPDANGDGVPDEQAANIDQEVAAAQIDQGEWVNNAGAYTKDGWEFEVKVEDNLWRPLDTRPSGLDGWTERNYSWVRIADGSDIKEGGKVTGDFQLVMSGLESNSRMIVRGEFKVEELRVDKWAYGILEEEKRAEEGGSAFCTD
jgi:hypothetical protein